MQYHKQIFQLAYYGNGGFQIKDLYSLPVYLRNFYAQEMKEAKEKEKQEYDKINKKSSTNKIPKGPL